MKMDEQVPNARVFDDEGKAIAYEHVGVGDSLKLVYKATRGKNWLEYSSAGMHVWLNGQPLTTLQEVTLTIDRTMVPKATITFNLESVDIDAGTLTALHAIVKTKEAKANGEGTTKTD